MLSVFRFLSSHKRIFFRKSILVAIPLVVIGAYAVHEAASEPDGISGYSKIGCRSCHGPLSSSTVVKISTDSTQIVAGHTYVFQISVANPSESAAGCDISVDNSASLAVNGTNSGLYILNKELTHNQPLIFTNDSAVWTFKYTAPKKAGIAHIYAAGNAVDNDGGISDTTSYIVTVVAPSGPQISAPATVRDTVLRGDTVQTSFWVKNVGNAALDIDHYGLKSGTFFSIADSNAHTIAVGDSAKVTVNFFPGSGKTYTDSLHIYSNDELTPISSTALVGLSTTGTFNVSSNPVNFGSVGLGHSDTLSVTLKNTGTGTLSITPQSFTFSNPNFTLVSLTPAVTPPFDVAPKGTVTAKIAYTPNAAELDTAMLPLTVTQYNGTGGTFDTNIVLVGMGTAASVNSALAVNSSILIYPNPSSGELNLSSTEKTGPADVEITDPAGRIVAQEEINLGSESSIDISGLPSGIYFLAVKPRDGQSFIKRIVLQK